MTQEDLQDDCISIGLIIRINIGERVLTNDAALKLVLKFKQKVKKLNINLDIDENYLMYFPSEDSELYCLNKFKNSTIDDNINNVFES